AAARPVVGGVLPDDSLALWHGFNEPFMMSLVAVGGGVVAHRVLRREQVQGLLTSVPLLERLNARRMFEGGLVGLTRLARAVLRVVATRRLQPQMFAIIAAALLLGILAFEGEPLVWGDRERLPASPAFVLLWSTGMVCAVSAAAKANYHRLVALGMMGGAG